MKKKKKKATKSTYAKALSEVAQDIANARAYREAPKRTAEEFLSERDEDKLAHVLFTSETNDELKREFEGE